MCLNFSASNWIYKAILVLLVVILISCNERPTSLTYPLLYDTVTVAAISSDTVDFFADAGTVFSPAQIFNTGVIFIGRYQDFSAASLIRFKESNLPDTLAWLTPDRIHSVRLLLPVNRYLIGDSVNPNFSFKVYYIKEHWTNKLTWDSILSGYTPNERCNPNPIGSFNGKIIFQDSTPDLEVELQPDFVVDWLQKNKDSIPIWGILLAPEPSTNVIYSFQSQYITDLPNIKTPKLVVKYRHPDRDTAIWNIHSAIDFSVTKVPELTDSNLLVIQSGYSYRLRFSLDVSKIPMFSGIHYAQLELTIDPSRTLVGNQGLDTVFTGAYFASRSLDTLPLVTFLGYKSGNKVIFPKVSTPIEIWLKENQKGDIYLYSYYWNDVRKLDRIAFFGLEEKDPNRKPKLKIIYSKRVKNE